jgi:DNA-binding CsgD family transcriptional regulator
MGKGYSMLDACSQDTDHPNALDALPDRLLRSAAILRRTAALARDTVTEWLMSSPGPDHADPVTAAYATGAFRTGIAVRIIYHDAIRDDPAVSARARHLSLSGALIRTTTALIPALAISDRKTAVILVDPADRSAGLTWSHYPAITAALAALFEQVWSTATPLTPSRAGVASGGVAHELGGTERELLRLLAAGATDEVAARHLGISLRTARRHMATLMNHLNAGSRFQAGAEAASRGWLA